MTQKIETNLIQSIASSEIKNITEDYCELGLDAVLDEGVLKDIPVFGTLTKLYSVGATIHGKILEKKILKFLYELDKISFEKRTGFVEKLTCDQKFEQRVGEHLLLLLERLDDMNKPQILARIFSAHINKKIDYEMFVRLSSVVDKTLISDLNKLKDFQKSQFDSFSATSLQNVGLVYLSVMAQTKYDENGKQTGGELYAITKLGEILIDIIE
jgi:hypothetical protein